MRWKVKTKDEWNTIGLGQQRVQPCRSRDLHLHLNQFIGCIRRLINSTQLHLKICREHHKDDVSVPFASRLAASLWRAHSRSEKNRLRTELRLSPRKQAKPHHYPLIQRHDPFWLWKDQKLLLRPPRWDAAKQNVSETTELSLTSLKKYTKSEICQITFAEVYACNHMHVQPYTWI